jgi:adenine deaminase
MVVSGKIVDILNRRIYNGDIVIKEGRIHSIEETSVEYSTFLLPGLIDSHVHIESSMLTPSQFSKLIVPRGTVAVISDPHEVANVLGVEGVEYMIEDAKKVPLKCFFGAPSCVPATSFETSGAVISSKEIKGLLERNDIWFLSEMMNFPGVVYRDEEVWAKLNYARLLNKRIDGHAPGLSGENLKQYCIAGITTDHECTTLKEAIEKINLGMVIQIREGSAAKDFDHLANLFQSHPKNIMLCTDDSHPDELLHNGHIDKIIKKGINAGINIFDLLYAATIKPIQHYNLPVGMLRIGDNADFIRVNSLDEFTIQETYIDGENIYKDGNLNFTFSPSKVINKFNAVEINEDDIQVKYIQGKNIRVLEAMDGDLITEEFHWKPTHINGNIYSSKEEDILKIVVLNRYSPSKPVVGFVKNIGLKEGAIACSVAHDSHNLIAVGVSDSDIVKALNAIIKCKGGMSVVQNNEVDILPLEVAGLMTIKDGKEVAKKYEQLSSKAKQMGSLLTAPFMTLSFMSLLVIPKLKIGDKGLFDVNSFSFTNLYV